MFWLPTRDSSGLIINHLFVKLPRIPLFVPSKLLDEYGLTVHRAEPQRKEGASRTLPRSGLGPSDSRRHSSTYWCSHRQGCGCRRGSWKRRPPSSGLWPDRPSIVDRAHQRQVLEDSYRMFLAQLQSSLPDLSICD